MIRKIKINHTGARDAIRLEPLLPLPFLGVMVVVVAMWLVCGVSVVVVKVLVMASIGYLCNCK